ncbi:integrase family protein [Dinoroseobacter shibae DFL 12 = DSM 16493]|jgi:integrase|uniref:Integrase family protein n=1 Tax=Dinoroseobacter shibae (strain DSM 16493 / NCIMB 14021 / DFL 12) TaxID=398580 RepID=A8LMN2_DINSH|nr:site-specific integrase [Dinoroseobacter shibae]ABV94957.1 integrase family protein [Dinoroseobacter shibae DFL 12 = DSM 16493]URF46377.1 site-specific integrase [Dinoroseobacter shibae]URF50683.1 site-specific integrase [Dinoroseobacter shibae]
MARRNSDNQRIKRKYLVWLKDARGLSEASIDKTAAAITGYDDWLGGKDFRAFHSERARSFKRHLGGLRNARTGSPLSASTVNSILRELKAFYYWLADQPGYKSRISRSDADYLSPDRKSDQARRGSLWKPHPSPDQARHVITNMAVGSIIERRNRAFLAFLFLTGSREGAAISVQVRHVDKIHRCVQFDGRDVYTKFGKSFTTGFYPMGAALEKILFGWINELKRDHLFSGGDPLFPKTRVGVGPDRRFQALGIARAPWASPSSAAKIFKRAFVDAGLPPFSPHRVRDTIAELASAHCRTPEEFKAWSQNMGHDDVLTTFRSYGSVAPGRQMELMTRFRERAAIDDDLDVIE